MHRTGFVAVGLALTLAANAMANEQIVRLSVDSIGLEANGGSGVSSLSHNGRWVAFGSFASNLVVGDTNGVADIFLRDNAKGTIQLVSKLSNGTQANGSSFDASLSAEGDYVVFTSFATNLVPGDTNGFADIFRYDIATQSIVRVSTAADGTQADAFCAIADVSANGRFVCFESAATTLVPGDTNGVTDIFRKDLMDGSIMRMSVGPGGVQANALSHCSSMSDDGNYVCFNSNASNLVAGDNNSATDVFRRDVTSALTLRASVSTSGAESSSLSISCAQGYCSPTGDYVAFTAEGDDLDVGDTNGSPDVYLRDFKTLSTRRISVTPGGGQGNGRSDSGSVSADGNTVAFRTDATNLIPGATSNANILVRRDGPAVSLRPQDINDSGLPGDGVAFFPNMSANGLHTSFFSDSTDLVPGDTNFFDDVFSRGTELNLDIKPRRAKQGNNVTFTPYGAVPNSFAALYITSYNNISVQILTTFLTMEPTGLKELGFTVPINPALDDAEIEFMVLGLGNGSLKVRAAFATANFEQ